VHRPRPDPHFRAYGLAPGCPIEVEVHCADGSVALLRGIVDRVPWLAGNYAQQVVLVDAVARPLPAECPARRKEAVGDEPEQEWRAGDPILVTLPDGQVVRCRVLSVDEDGNMQVVPEHEVVVR
jgi:hypothetical protein